MTASLVILGEYAPAFEPHVATDAAIVHSSAMLGVKIDSAWVSTADINDGILRKHHGLWIAPGSPYKDMARALAAIRSARENSIPCLGTCGGFQHMVIEYARNVLGFHDAQHAEYDPYSSNLFVSRLACSLVGRQMELRFVRDSLVAKCYDSLRAVEQYYCNFGVRPDRVAVLGSGILRIVGSDSEGEVRVVELTGHPFFVGTLYVPQATSTPSTPHPLITKFLQAVATHRSRP
jgi:CTP synthase (UTP-ammonia lyase)